MGGGVTARSVLASPLPLRDGVAASRVYLPPGPWTHLLDFLLERFEYMPAHILRDRLARGDIVDDQGVPQTLGSPYRPSGWLWYYREVVNEPRVPGKLQVLHHDERLVVVDKPHFLACIPGGRYLQETALTRLRRSLDLPSVSPIHRLDRDTAGVMLFCVDPRHRGAYQGLFQSREVLKEYEAVAPLRKDLVLPLVYRSRLVNRPQAFTVHEVAGPPNSQTRIELISSLGEGWGHYRLRPHTGRKHQLRAHLSALGIPICNDRFYPELSKHADEDDFAQPLQLLARSIAFTDPITGKPQYFKSRQQLSFKSRQQVGACGDAALNTDRS